MSRGGGRSPLLLPLLATRRLTETLHLRGARGARSARDRERNPDSFQTREGRDKRVHHTSAAVSHGRIYTGKCGNVWRNVWYLWQNLRT